MDLFCDKKSFSVCVLQSWKLQLHQLVFVCYALPRPWEASIFSWRLGRSATLSPWLTSASFNIVGPFNTTIHSWPSCKLNTSPYVSANCEEKWHHLAINLPSSHFKSCRSTCIKFRCILWWSRLCMFPTTGSVQGPGGKLVGRRFLT